MTALTNSSALIAELDQRRIHYQIAVVRSDALMISVAVPGERWEIEFFDDGHAELEIFTSRGVEKVDSIKSRLFSYFDEQQ